MLVHINYKNTSADIGKYATYQCTECLIFEKKCFVADGVIKCIDCLYNVVEKFELPHLRPTVMIGGEFSDKLFVKNKGLVMSGYNVYILGSHLNDDLESYVDCNQRYNKFGLPNKPLLIVNIPDSEYHQTPKKEIETYRYETIIKDDYKYASKPDFVYNFCKQSKLSTADTRNHLPAKLATPAWALVRYVCEMMRENFKVISTSLFIIDCGIAVFPAKRKFLFTPQLPVDVLAKRMILRDASEDSNAHKEVDTTYLEELEKKIAIFKTLIE